MKTLLGLILIIALGAAAYWYFKGNTSTHDLQQVQSEAAKRTEQIADTVKEKWNELSLKAPDIKEELERTGKVVRKKAQTVGNAIADATADARITTTIKAKLVKDPDLSALQISVNTTDGVVTLSGSVSSAEEIAKAMKLALDTDGVREAISTLQVKATK